MNARVWYRRIASALLTAILATSLTSCLDSGKGAQLPGQLGVVFGTVTLNGAPAAGVIMSLFLTGGSPTSNGLIGTTMTAADGTYGFQNLSRDTYQVMIGGGLPADATCDPPSSSFEIAGLADARADFVCTAPDVGRIHGRVVRDDGEPVSVVVQMIPDAPGANFIEDAVSLATDGNGNYSFDGVSEGQYLLQVKDDPDGTRCAPALHTASITLFTLTVSADFVCTRDQASERIFSGVLTVAGGDPSHDPFVWAAGENGKGTDFIAGTNGANIVLSAPGLSPSAFPQIVGAIDPIGGFVLETPAPIAGIAGVQVRVVGTLVGNALTLEITVGGNGALPNGTPIVYRFVGTDPLGGSR